MEQLVGQEFGDKSYSNQGTAAHFLAAECLQGGFYEVPEFYLGRWIYVDECAARWAMADGTDKGSGYFLVDEDLVTHVNLYLATILAYKGDTGALFVEQELDISGITGEEGACGTSDAIIIREGNLQVHDLKFGMTPVDAEFNTQLIIYALAALDFYGAVYGIDSVTLVIHQPRLNSFPFFNISLEQLELFRYDIKKAAEHATIALTRNLDAKEGGTLEGYLLPGDHCRKGYCKARHSCPALAKFSLDRVEEAQALGVATGEADLNTLGYYASHAPMIEDWIKEINKRLNAEMLAGKRVPGFKVVEGRKGNREWVNAEEVEKLLKDMKIPQTVIYETKIKSPTQMTAEAKLGNIPVKKWLKVEEHITQKPAGLVVVPDSDNRKEVFIHEAINDFEDLTQIH
jgi:hypothetical protein